MGKTLEILAERSGAAILGSLADNVFYLGFVGHVSAGLGAKCAAGMEARLAKATSAHWFCNALLAGTIDFSARSAMVRAALTSRHHIVSMTTLVATSAATALTHAIASMLDTEVAICMDATEFDQRLVRAAPLAHLKLREIELTSLNGSARWRSSFAPAPAV